MAILYIFAGLFFTIYTAINPLKVKGFSFNIVTGPLISLLIGILFGIIDFLHIKHGILGYSNLRPWEILTIFYTVAYVSISVDLSGILDYFAFRIIHFARGKGILLFFFFYIFASILTIFTSNDIVILTLTPIIFYLRRHAKINIIPLLFAEFFGANTLSMLLYIGNPTNIIVGNALGLTFNGYFKTMYFPTIIATILNILFLFILFRKRITKTYSINKTSNFKLRSLYDAIGSSVLLLAMLICLVLSDTIPWEIWQVTLFFASLMFIEDLTITGLYVIKHSNLYLTELSAGLRRNFSIFGSFCYRTDMFVIVKRLPWKVLPFLITVFIFIACLVDFGIVDYITLFLTSTTSSILGNIYLFGFSSLFLANIINNQPMTVLMSNVLINSHNQLNQLANIGATYAVIIASNLGANLSIIGALAGLMWEKILREKNVRISYQLFLKIGFIITPVVFLITLLSLWLTLI